MVNQIKCMEQASLKKRSLLDCIDLKFNKELNKWKLFRKQVFESLEVQKNMLNLVG